MTFCHLCLQKRLTVYAFERFSAVCGCELSLSNMQGMTGRIVPGFLSSTAANLVLVHIRTGALFMHACMVCFQVEFVVQVRGIMGAACSGRAAAQRTWCVRRCATRRTSSG